MIMPSLAATSTVGNFFTNQTIYKHKQWSLSEVIFTVFVPHHAKHKILKSGNISINLLVHVVYITVIIFSDLFITIM